MYEEKEFSQVRGADGADVAQGADAADRKSVV